MARAERLRCVCSAWVAVTTVTGMCTCRYESRINLISRPTKAAILGECPQTGQAIATLAGHPLVSNPAFHSISTGCSRFASTPARSNAGRKVTARRTVKKDWQAAWLLRAVSCMDLTTLSGDDTDERVRRLCAKARHPIQDDLVKRLGIEELNIKVAAVCVYHTFVETAVRALEGSGVRVAAVSTGFPAGLSPLTERVAEIRRSVEAGAQRHRRGHHPRSCVRRQDGRRSTTRVAAFKQASGRGAHESHSRRPAIC